MNISYFFDAVTSPVKQHTAKNPQKKVKMPSVNCSLSNLYVKKANIIVRAKKIIVVII